MRPGDVLLELGPAADRTAQRRQLYEVDTESASGARSESRSDDVALGGPRQSRSRTRVVCTAVSKPSHDSSQADDHSAPTSCGDVRDEDSIDVILPKPPAGQATKNSRVSSKARCVFWLFKNFSRSHASKNHCLAV